jgi:hypothetical protein
MAEYTAASLPYRIGGPDRRGYCPHLPKGLAPLNSSMATFAHRPPRFYSGSVYIQGGCALLALQRGLGLETMDRFLRGLVSSHRYGVLTTTDFVTALRKIAPGSFDVDRWLRRSKIRTKA